MKTMLVWFLVSTSYYGEVHYSPPIPELEDCRRLQVIVNNHQSYRNTSATCVQLRVPQ